ncbi:MAG: uroporphyrinogen decarboxylase [Gemmatimonadetes bacterium]|nr:uroporphyrinogen decarboxylase [Gemmatimonadota bacterium]
MNDRILRALRCEPVDRTPVWFMRQAGRSLPRYRELRKNRDMFEILRDPEAAAQITALPLEYYPVDAAILFNDLSTPFLGAGLSVEMRGGVGPVVDRPITSPADVDRLRPFDPRDTLDFCLEQIRILTGRLDVPVLGFVGAPFTLCSYLVPGPRAHRIDALKAFIWREPAAWHALADYWAVHLAEFAVAQHEAGAAAVQVFDSWAGALSREDYEAHVLPHSAKLLGRLRKAGVVSIHFATGNPALLPLLAAAGGDAIGVDWRQPINAAWNAIGKDRAIQGNLDPAVLLAGTERATAKTREILERVGGRPGHVFNLGHGILPETDPAVVRAVVECVHEFPVRHAGRQGGGT